MTCRQQQPRSDAWTDPQVDPPTHGVAAYLPHAVDPRHGPAVTLTPCHSAASDIHTNGAAVEASPEARAKRRAFIQALARQAARELAAQALTARDD